MRWSASETGEPQWLATLRGVFADQQRTIVATPDASTDGSCAEDVEGDLLVCASAADDYVCRGGTTSNVADVERKNSVEFEPVSHNQRDQCVETGIECCCAGTVGGHRLRDSHASDSDRQPIFGWDAPSTGLVEDAACSSTAKS